MLCTNKYSKIAPMIKTNDFGVFLIIQQKKCTKPFDKLNQNQIDMW